MVIPFEEIASGSTVRLAVIDDVQYLSIVDIIMCVCGKNRTRANEVWDRLNTKHKEELTANCGQFQFRGNGQQIQTVITFPGALKLIMFLPGDVAAMYRSKMTTILQRYFAGDQSLLAEVEANQVSESPIAQLARASLVSASIEDVQDRKRKREREDYDLLEKKIDVINKFAGAMTALNPKWKEDTRFRMQTESWLKNMAFNSGYASITNGDGAPSVDKSISISQVAQEMGFRLKQGHLTTVGKSVAAKYREKYHEEPGSHAQWVDGAERMVKSYTERDRDLIVEALADAGFTA